MAQLNIANVISRQSMSGRGVIDGNDKAGVWIAQHSSHLARRMPLQQLIKQGGASLSPRGPFGQGGALCGAVACALVVAPVNFTVLFEQGAGVFLNVIP